MLVCLELSGEDLILSFKNTILQKEHLIITSDGHLLQKPIKRYFALINQPS